MVVVDPASLSISPKHCILLPKKNKIKKGLHHFLCLQVLQVLVLKSCVM